MTDLSPPAVAALCALAAHERLYLFKDGRYRARLNDEISYSATDVRALVFAGYVKVSRVRVRCAEQSVVLTEAGTARLMAGHARGAA
jgi:hypothetical protein